MAQMHNPAHPGAVLAQWLESITVTEAADKLGVTRPALSRVLNEQAGISPEMDLRLSKALGTTPGMWHAMQSQYDMWQAQRHFKAGKVKRIITTALPDIEEHDMPHAAHA
jgi:addiction module HigA family antidote